MQEASNNQLLEEFNKFKLEMTVGQTKLEGSIMSMTQEIKHLTDALSKSVTSQATKEELSNYRANAVADHKALEVRLSKLEDWNTWLVRIVFGIVITAILGLVVAKRVF